MRRALRSGAQDCVARGTCTIESLDGVVEMAVERFHLQRELLERRDAVELRYLQLDAFTAGVAHDLRNPLGLIAMCAQMTVELAGGDAALRRQQEMILRSVQRATRLVQDLLHVARHEAGSLHLDCTICDAGALIDEAVEFHRGAAQEKYLRIVTAAPGPLPPVAADREQVLRVFQNLLDNAVKFTPPRGCITLHAEPDGAFVRFAVHNTGPGISGAQLPHVFDRLWQARTGDARGVGLGLPIARGIVEAHGGRIGAESIAGRGTTFHFTIPAAE